MPSALGNYMLAALTWILMAEIYLRLHVAFPVSPLLSGLSRALSISPTFFGIALLQGSLIQLSSSPNRRAEVSGRRRWPRMCKSVFWGTLVLSAALQLLGFSALGVASVWCAGMLHLGGILAWGRAERKRNQAGRRVARGRRNVLIIGATSLGLRIAHYLNQHAEMDRSVLGFLDDGKSSLKGVLGRTSELPELARTGFVDEVILASPHDRDLTLRVLRTAQQLRLDVKMAPDLFGCEPAQRVESIDGIPLISLHEERLPVGRLLLKRALDLGGAAAALLVMAPGLALIAILVKLDSPGPALYAAPRAGWKGRPFRCYKFRTMVQDADNLKKTLRSRNERQGPFFKIADDPRVTRVGRFLRRYSLDELPQLWNVLKGEMSLVGPRPHPMDDFSAYAIEHLPRLDVIPGMTGLWQVTARHDPSFQAGMNLDIEYIRRWSLGMDLRILFKTAAAVLRGSGE